MKHYNLYIYLQREHQSSDWYTQKLASIYFDLVHQIFQLNRISKNWKNRYSFFFHSILFWYKNVFKVSGHGNVQLFTTEQKRSLLISSSLVTLQQRPGWCVKAEMSQITQYPHAFLMSFWQLPCEQTWVKMVFDLYVFVLFGVLRPDDLKLNVHANTKCCGTNVTQSQHWTNLVNGQILLSYFKNDFNICIM